ncbi:MAG: phosphatidylethanolamine N-methyltransferase family protein [Gemmatimonadetes bacterium]|nr:phosphatidylethanolamine N-methyltransferase family protein [Gemmatimonadota bacterium]
MSSGTHTPDTPRARTAGVIAPPPLIYGVPLLAGLLLNRWSPWPLVAGRATMPGALVLVLLGFIALPAVLAFRKARTHPEPWKPTKALVTVGPYRFSRNPMYVGFTLCYLGIAGWRNSVWPLLALPVVLGVMQVGVIHREERYLERLFGEDYRAYRARVRRWF